MSDGSLSGLEMQQGESNKKFLEAHEAAQKANEKAAAAEAVEDKKEELRQNRANDTTYVVHCARIECTKGMRESCLTLEATHGVKTRQIPQITVKDTAPDANVINFGGCFSMENPSVKAAAEAAVQAAQDAIEKKHNEKGCIGRFFDNVVDFFVGGHEMEITYQGLRIQLPFEGVIGTESFSMDASLNEHVSVELTLLVDEETIEPAIHGIADGDGIEVYEDKRDGILFAGKITDTWMKKECGLCCMGLKALSYTMEWSLAPVSRSFQDLTYEQVLKKVLLDQPGAEIIDSITKGMAIPDFLIQYEESDWAFLVRLASHFGTFLVPDCCAAHGRAYFGLPDLGEETVLCVKCYNFTAKSM